jgi:hypothetical protein
LLVLFSLKQFDNLTLQQGSHARKQFGITILLLQQGNSHQVHAVWEPLDVTNILGSGTKKYSLKIDSN